MPDVRTYEITQSDRLIRLELKKSSQTWKDVTVSDCLAVAAGNVREDGVGLRCLNSGTTFVLLNDAKWDGGPDSGSASLPEASSGCPTDDWRWTLT